MRTGYEGHAEDDDSAQPGNLVRDVMDAAARDRLVGNIVAQLRNGVTEPVLQRALGYLRKVDQNLGDRVEKGVRGGQERVLVLQSAARDTGLQSGGHALSA